MEYLEHKTICAIRQNNYIFNKSHQKVLKNFVKSHKSYSVQFLPCGRIDVHKTLESNTGDITFDISQSNHIALVAEKDVADFICEMFSIESIRDFIFFVRKRDILAPDILLAKSREDLMDFITNIATMYSGMTLFGSAVVSKFANIPANDLDFIWYKRKNVQMFLRLTRKYCDCKRYSTKKSTNLIKKVHMQKISNILL